MASLKEIRARITSVASTQKITSAMKMVSAAKLKKAESITLKFVPYRTKLMEALTNYLGSLEESVNIRLAEQRPVQKVALVVFSSNSGLCGVYNSNIAKLFKTRYDEYAEEIGKENIIVYVVGKKIHDYAKRIGIKVEKAYHELSDKPDFQAACDISDLFVNQFLEGKVDKVELIYNHYKSAGVQQPLHESFLPLSTDIGQTGSDVYHDYIVEPSKEEFVNALVPKVLRTHFYSVILDAFTAQHGARMTAMHIASDNADQLSQELRIQYNKARQNVITNELIDIVGGAEALNK